MKTCYSCFYCVPKYKGTGHYFKQGTCYQANRRVQANMTACQLYKERKETVPVKSNPKKRNQYRDKDGNLMPGVTIPEILDKPLTILAKRQYVWGLFDGLAVKVKGSNDKLAIIEITADIPIKALCDPHLAKPPFKAKFVQKVSKSKKKYYTIEVLDGEENSGQDGQDDIPF